MMSNSGDADGEEIINDDLDSENKSLLAHSQITADMDLSLACSAGPCVLVGIKMIIFHRAFLLNTAKQN